MPVNILNLSSYMVNRVEEDEHDYHIYASVIDAPTTCVNCKSTTIRRFGRREQLLKDLPIHGKRVGIYVDTRRFQCLSCNKTFYEPLPEADNSRNMTKRLANWIGKQAVSRTFLSLADEVGVAEGTVRSIFRDYINELEKTVRFEIPQWMGIDEIHLIKPRGVISNIQNNTIVEILKDRNKKTVINYFARLNGIDQIHYVAMDMWKPYKDAVELMIPHAKVVIDKFHVVRMANDALERVRKSLRQQLTTKQRRGLMHDRFVLLKRERDLTPQESLLLDGWCQNYPELGLAYRQKEDFYMIYESNSISEARKRYVSWSRTLTPEIATAYSDLTRAWNNWEPYIVNYFEHPITNAYTESLNGLIRLMNRLGRGYSFEALRAKILFAEGAYRIEKKRPKFQRRDAGTMADTFALAYSVPGKTTERDKNYGVDISIMSILLEKEMI